MASVPSSYLRQVQRPLPVSTKNQAFWVWTSLPASLTAMASVPIYGSGLRLLLHFWSLEISLGFYKVNEASEKGFIWSEISRCFAVEESSDEKWKSLLYFFSSRFHLRSSHSTHTGLAPNGARHCPGSRRTEGENDTAVLYPRGMCI